MMKRIVLSFLLMTLAGASVQSDAPVEPAAEIQPTPLRRHRLGDVREQSEPRWYRENWFLNTLAVTLLFWNPRFQLWIAPSRKQIVVGPTENSASSAE